MNADPNYELPPLSADDLALALFGVYHMQNWWRGQPKCGYQRKELAKAKALNRKISGILCALEPPLGPEGERDWSDSDKPAYGPLPAARKRLRAKVEEAQTDG